MDRDPAGSEEGEFTCSVTVESARGSLSQAAIDPEIFSVAELAALAVPDPAGLKSQESECPADENSTGKRFNDLYTPRQQILRVKTKEQLKITCEKRLIISCCVYLLAAVVMTFCDLILSNFN